MSEYIQIDRDAKLIVFFTFALKSNYRYHHTNAQFCVCLLTRKMEGWGEGNSNPLMRWVGLGGI